VHCISNHDQVGNRALGERLHHGLPPEFYRAVSMLLCLSPYTPMLFMGQEWGASTPFLYFTDHPGELGKKMAWYRAEEFRRQGMNGDDHVLERMPDPQAETTFAASVLRWSERDESPHRQTLALYRACLQLRAREPVFQNPPRNTWNVRPLASDLLALRWKRQDRDWLLLVAVRSPSKLELNTDPFLAPRAGRRWTSAIFSNDQKFGGRDEPPPLAPDSNTLTLDRPSACLLKED
jgi:maltooligosyltrehalose trehalohydrolase